MIIAGYKGSDISEKIHNRRYKEIIQHETRKRTFYCLYLQINESIVTRKSN